MSASDQIKRATLENAMTRDKKVGSRTPDADQGNEPRNEEREITYWVGRV